MARVLIADSMSELALETFQSWGLDADYEPGLAPEELVRRIEGYDGLAVRSATKATAEIIAAAETIAGIAEHTGRTAPDVKT